MPYSCHVGDQANVIVREQMEREGQTQKTLEFRLLVTDGPCSHVRKGDSDERGYFDWLQIIRFADWHVRARAWHASPMRM